LIFKTEKKGNFGKKKAEISITETGIKLLNAKKQELEQKVAAGAKHLFLIFLAHGK
jgi:hypothetical protein